MLHECVAIARSRGAGPVVIVVHQTNTAKQMYVRLGWQPIAMCRQYTNPRTYPYLSASIGFSFAAWRDG